jgi:glycosyltransferase involved in cell wall biosynthesis
MTKSFDVGASPPMPLASRPRVLLLGPSRTAVSGVATHLNQLFASPLVGRFELMQFQVGSEGRAPGYARTCWRLLSSPFEFAARLIRSRAHIVHINTSLEPRSYWRDLVYLVLAKALRRKVVYQVHGGALPEGFFAGSPALSELLRRVLSWPEAVVLVASSEMAAYRKFATRARLLRIPNAVAPEDLSLRAGGCGEDRTLAVVYLGRLAADKGIFETIEAVRILRDRGVPVRLTLAGSGPDQPRAAAAIEAARLADRAQIVAPQFGVAKRRLWQEADVLAFPTYHREGLPYALLEAMAAGVVPVVSPVGAIPDVVEDGVHGLFVPAHRPDAVADALERLINDRTLLQRLATAARARVVEQYSVERMASAFAALYANLYTRVVPDRQTDSETESGSSKRQGTDQ